MLAARRSCADIALELFKLHALQSSRAVRQAHAKSGVNVVLEQTVENLGQSGDRITASRGFARNFLIPGGLARQLPKLRAKISAPGEAADAKRLKGKGAAVTSAQNLQHVLNLLYNSPVEIVRKAKKNATKAQRPKLRQPVTPACIVRAILNQHKVSLSPQLMAADLFLDRAGSHEVALRLKDGSGQPVTMRVRINTQSLAPIDLSDDLLGTITAAASTLPQPAATTAAPL